MSQKNGRKNTGWFIRDLSLDISTTQVKAVVRGYGRNDFDIVEIDIPKEAKVIFHGGKGYDHQYLPGLLLKVVIALEARGWLFGKIKRFSFSIRQHDMVVLDWDGNPLIPALSWQCNAATAEVKYLINLGIDKIVGPIEPRFVFPKLLWALSQDPELHHKVASVTTTDAYIASKLGIRLHICGSEAISNSLLNQKTKKKAVEAFAQACLNPDWFPGIIDSGKLVGMVKGGGDGEWGKLRSKFAGAKYYSSLGDNHASGVGCGLNDFTTMIVSMGSSGTVIRMAEFFWKLLGKVACFGFYKKRLLLDMMASCATYYKAFVEEYGEGRSYKELDDFLANADISTLRLEITREGEGHSEKWDDYSLVEKIASCQISIALFMLRLVKKMLVEVDEPGVAKILRIILTGGLSRSIFMRNVFALGLKIIDPNLDFRVGVALGKASFQTAAWGALINAMSGGQGIARIYALMETMCPTESFVLNQDSSYYKLEKFMRANLGD